VLLLGVDAFLGLPTWRRWTELFDFAHLAVANRPGYSLGGAAMPAALAEQVSRRQAAPDTLGAAPAGRLVQFAMTPLAISATDIRARCAAGQSLRYLLPRRLLTIFPGINSTSESMDIQHFETLVVSALEDIKGKDIRVIDTTRLTSLFDRVIIATADSNRQTRALARHVADKAREAGIEVVGIEGEAAANGCWSTSAASSCTSCRRPCAATTTSKSCGAPPGPARPPAPLRPRRLTPAARRPARP
jgi:ribosome silencing factor RsfS/YbeB/iojap